MCYINGIRVSLETYLAYKKQQKELKQLMAVKLFYQPARRAHDYTEWPIIVVDAAGNWDAVPAEWGIVRQGIKTRAEANESRKMYPTYNAIGAEILQKTTFKLAARKGRCLVPSTWFFESMHVPKVGKKGQPLKATDTIPFKISVKDQKLFWMAGIYLPWFDPSKDQWIKTFAICTADGGYVMSQIHNAIDNKTGQPKRRQPTVLTTELAERWTDKDLSDEEIIKIASYQFDNSLLEYHPVKKKFWEEPETAIEEVHYDNLPEIHLN